MKKWIIGIVFVGAVVAILGFMSHTTQYVADLSAEVDALEDNLSSLEMRIANGELTPDEAADAQEGILSQMNAISKKTTRADIELNEEEKARFAVALTRLKDALGRYQDTLVSLEQTASQSKRVSKKSGSRSGGASAPITDVISDTIEDLEEYAEETFEETEYEELIEGEDSMESEEMSEDEITEDSEEETLSEDTVQDNTASTTDDGIEDNEATEEEVTE